MRKQTGLLLIILFANLLPAQLITSIPSYPTQYDSIVIYFDATQGDAGLQGYTGNVYTHTGVTINGNRWQNVIESWGNDNTQPQLTRIDTDLYELIIGYPHEFYSTDTGGKITELCFVFRSAGADGPTGRDVGGADIFYDLFDPGITMLIEAPFVDLSFADPLRSPVFASLTDTVQICGKAATINTEADSIKLFIGDQYILGIQDSVINYDFIATDYKIGAQRITLVGIDTAGITDTASFYIMINPPISDKIFPDNVEPGIIINDANSVTLSLFAPYKDFVYVIGDFNDWMVDTTYFMNRYYVSEDSVVWWLQIDNLDPDTEYAFQYLVDGEIRIADPYTEKVLDPWNDKYINKYYNIYPNLKAYPDGKTKDIVGTFQTVTPDYTWTAENYQRSEKQRLVIYELLLRDFLHQHDFNTLIDTLDYLDNLGINAIELMPFNEFEGNLSWGYNPSFYFAVDKYYGPANDLKEFIDECHRRGIAVIMDIVLNHSYGQSPLVRLYDHGDHTTSPENPWYNEKHSFTNPDAQWGYDFDHESPATQYFIDKVNRHWITEYKIDGFRFDFTKGFTNDIKGSDDPWGSKYDTDRVRLLKRMADRIWATDSSVYVIMEHLAENREEEELANYGMMLWGNCNWNYAQASMGYTNDSDFSWGFYKTRGWTKPHLVTYMESHDEERLMYKNLQYGKSYGNYNIKNPLTALNRIKLVSAFFYTLPGPKMIWQFGELGYDYSINYDGRLGEKPVRWDYLSEPARLNLYKTVKALLKLRNENDVFTNPGTSVQLSLAGNGKRIAMTSSMNVVIIGNFGVTNLDIAPNFPYGGVWYDYFSGDSIYVQFTTDLIPLAPGEFHIYTDQRLDPPEQDILSDIDNELPDLPEKFTLYPNYPNPFNASTTFQYDLEKQSDIHFQIYDILGRQVYSQDQYDQPAGRYSFAWEGIDSDGRELQSGVYFFVIRRNDTEKIQKITLLK